MSQLAAASINKRAEEIRAIARGIYDKQERRMLLRFVANSEKLAKIHAPANP